MNRELLPTSGIRAGLSAINPGYHSACQSIARLLHQFSSRVACIACVTIPSWLSLCAANPNPDAFCMCIILLFGVVLETHAYPEWGVCTLCCTCHSYCLESESIKLWRVIFEVLIVYESEPMRCFHLMLCVKSVRWSRHKKTAPSCSVLPHFQRLRFLE